MKKLLPLLLLLLLLGCFCLAHAGEVYDIIKLDGDNDYYLVHWGEDWSLYWKLVDGDGNVIKEHFAASITKSINGTYRAMVGGLWGIMDSTGEFIAEPQFNDLNYFYDGMARVRSGALYGYIDDSYQIIVQPRFEDACNFDNGLARVKENGLWGYIDKTGQYVIEPSFDKVYDFVGDTALVIKDDKVGLIDRSGRYVAETPYMLSSWWFSGDYAEYEIYDLDENYQRVYGLLLQDGTVIEPKFQEIGAFRVNGRLCRARPKGYWGYIDRSGEFVVEPQFADCYNLEDGMAVVMNANGLYGAIDEEGNFIVPMEYEYLYVTDGVIYASLKIGESEGVINPDGSYKIEPKFEYVGRFLGGVTEAKLNGLYGFIDEEGEWVIEPQFKFVTVRTEDYAAVSMDENAENWDIYDYNRTPGAGLVDLHTGELLLDLGHDNIYFCDDGSICAEKDGAERTYIYSDGALTEITVVGSDIELDDYKPFEGSKVAAPEGTSEFKFDEDNSLPGLDGATELLPLYSAFARATNNAWSFYNDVWNLYEEKDEGFFTCSGTFKAYKRLIEGKCDIIFCLEPTDREILSAKLNGMELEYTLIGYEALVFIADANNPVENLTLDEIRGIYSGEITNWGELGCEGLGEIIAYQRKSSEAQAAFVTLMGDTPLMDAPSHIVDYLFGTTENIAYRNFPNSIGYSFRSSLSNMPEGEIKLLSLDGVFPSEDNIKSAAYPLIIPVYAVSLTGNDNLNVQCFLNWMTGDEAQKLLEMSGYVGLKR